MCKSKHMVLWSLVALILAGLAAPGWAQGQVYLNGKPLEGERAFRYRGRTMLPARTFFRGLGGDIQWCEGNCDAGYSDHRWSFRPRTRVYYYDNTPRYFPGESFVRGRRLFVPGNVINDLGGRYYWQGSNLNIDFPRRPETARPTP